MEENNINENRIRMVTNRASSSINTFITEFPDVNVYDVMEYIKMLTIYGAKIIAGSSFKNGERPNVRTVINDLHQSTIEALDALIPINKELADDYKWEDEEEPVEPETTE